MKHAAPFLVWFAALWWLWMLLVGEWNRIEWIAATCAATAVAAVGELARVRADAHPSEGMARAREFYSVVPMIVIDFGIVMWALLRALVTRRIPDGSFRAGDATDPWTALLATYSPNAYVVDTHEIHRLVPFDKSQEPA